MRWSLRRPVGLAAALAVVGSVVLGVLPAGAQGSDPRGANRMSEAPGFSLDPAAPVVALTFDDGPHPTYTPQILDILRAKGVRATFFQIGRQAEAHPDLVRRIVAEGHIIANHTWDHAHLRGASDERFAFEVDHTTQVLQSISGQDVVCTRPPYGDADPFTVARLAAHGQASVVWSADSNDYEKPGVPAIVSNALSGLRPGGVILFHDGGGTREQTIAALPQIIDQIRARGYQIAPVCDGRSHRPEGHLEVAASDEPELVHLAGWAADPDTDTPLTVRILIDGAQVAELAADRPRDDARRGFDTTIPAAPGDRRVCVVAVNAGLGSADTELGCATVSVAEIRWYDRLGRALGLLDGSERFDVPAPLPSDEALGAMVGVLFPRS